MAVGPVRRDDDTAEFFDAATDGVFLIRRCGQCSAAAEPQAKTCPSCGSADLRSEEASGGARVVSWSVVHGRQTVDGPPIRTVVVVAELDEGPWWWSQLADADPDTVHVGQRLRICFERSGEHEPVPVFRLADDTDGS
ncbi:MAG TPA: OB-fold domain-containing protein [Streptosporangiaceae bacterium]|nr:OB-fold domain-containing protein [Streptosporangiaceae bacterium]